MPDDFEFDDAEMDALLEEWSAVDTQAAFLLAEAWPDAVAEREAPAGIEEVARSVRDGVAGSVWPFDYFGPDLAPGLPAHADAAELWLDCASSTISPFDDPVTTRGLGADEAAILVSTEHADWLGVVLGLVRRGVGAQLSGELAMADLEAMEEIEGDPDDPDYALSHLELVVELLAPRWQALGALDEDRCLTDLGMWGLPRALHLVWSES